MRIPKDIFTTSKTKIAAIALTATVGLAAVVGVAGAVVSNLSIGDTRMEMYDIGVSLMENGEKVSWRDYQSSNDGYWKETEGILLKQMLSETDGKLDYDRNYTEALQVCNSGTINQYVRVSIYRYWEDKFGNKLSKLDPSYIELNILADNDNGWIMDTSASTNERIVLYYTKLLLREDEDNPNSGINITSAFADTLRISSEVWDRRDLYDGARFVVRVDVDAVQEHNAADAILSAWGRNVTVRDGVLSLN